MAQQPRHSKKRQEKKEEIEEESISIFSKEFFEENKKTIISLCVVLVVFGGIVGGLYAYSGVSPPFSVINSGSMQHSDKSQIGVIDTGDMVYVKNPNSKSITTYIEGSNCGYSKFGDYGDVIVYITETRNIIHRAMVKLEVKEEASSGEIKLYMPALEKFEKWDLLDSSNVSIKTTSWNAEEKILKIKNGNKFQLTVWDYVNNKETNIEANVYSLCKNLKSGEYGYLTKGDHNSTFDQSSGIYSELIKPEIIKSVALFEIPWIGSLKLMINGKGNIVPSNSKTMLFITIIGIIAIFAAIYFGLDYLDRKKKDK